MAIAINRYNLTCPKCREKLKVVVQSNSLKEQWICKKCGQLKEAIISK